jgi:hypothetical protein
MFVNILINVKKAATLGWEQEYFLIDRSLAFTPRSNDDWKNFEATLL